MMLLKRNKKKQAQIIVCELTDDGLVFVNNKEVFLNINNQWTGRGLNLIEVLYFRKFVTIIDYIDRGTKVIYKIN